MPPNRKVVKTKSVLDTKKDSNGNIFRFKARLVVKGLSQVPGVDFQEIFSPVSKYTTIRFFFALSTYFGWDRKYLDVKNVFVNATLSEEIYVEQPEGFVQRGKENHVYRLKKALYGLRQSSREWNMCHHNFLLSNNCEVSAADPTL